MNRELLEKPFGQDQIKQIEGIYGKALDYVEGHTVIQRLNDAFDGNWSFEVLKHEILKDTNEVIILGKLTAGDVVKTQFGSSEITRSEAGEIVCLADDLKAGATDALKKAATLLAVGLHLYNGDSALHDNSGLGKSPDHHAGQTAKGSNGGGRENGGNGGNGNGGRITNKQLNYAVNLGRDIGWYSKDLDQESVNIFGVKMAYLTIKDASAFIDLLKSKAA